MVATFETTSDDVATLPRQQRCIARLLLDVEPHSPRRIGNGGRDSHPC